MTEKEMRQFVACGLVEEQNYNLFKSIAKDLDFVNVEARKFALWTFLYRTGKLSETEYKNHEIYEKAKKDGRI